MIKVENLTKFYGDKLAIDKISFDIDEVQIVGFLGPNGAGKTTTIKIITTFLPPTSGSVTVDGLDVVQQSIDVRKKIGYLPENVPLYPELRVKEYLFYRADLKKVGDKKKAVSKVVEECSLQDVYTKLIGHLSKGYRQRVGLADALIADPPILILDEPTIGLDPNQIRTTRKLIRELGKNRTVLISSHILSEIEQIAQKAVIIHNGKVVGQGTLDELKEKAMQYRSVLVEARGKSDNVLNSLQKISGVLKIEYEPIKEDKEIYKFDLKLALGNEQKNDEIEEDIFKAAVSDNWIIRQLHTSSLSLEDAFAQITSIDEELEEQKNDEEKKDDENKTENNESAQSKEDSKDKPEEEN